MIIISETVFEMLRALSNQFTNVERIKHYKQFRNQFYAIQRNVKELICFFYIYIIVDAILKLIILITKYQES